MSDTLKDITKYCLTVILILTFYSCNSKQSLFTLTDPEATGVIFTNHLTISDSLNIMNYIYLYNGGGVATGDINNDGLPDIYFTSNQGSNKLFLNKGNFKFEDITTSAGVTGVGNWKTGVTLADVNGDGWLDIYVCAVGGFNGLKGKNQLYINNHNLSFTEAAALYGIDEPGFNTQAVFFDYDKDGDLDMYLVKHGVHSTENYQDTSLRNIPDSASGDKLFRNEISNGKNSFTDVTREAGIYSGKIGFGLNAVVNDFNNDGWPDIYVSNDFNEEDYYYLNNGNGTFSESNKEAFGHESHFSMGSDAADINNDGWPDLITLDMLAENEKVLKSSVADDPPDIYQYKKSYGYAEQCSRNCLQLNTGAGSHFSEIGLFAGIAATDWSWSPLLADFDNDGVCDLFITNGIYRRPNDLDFINYYAHAAEAYDASKKKLSDHAYALMPEGKLSNYLFRGSASLQFKNVGATEGITKKSFSNGAAYADFDNDGDLDLVVNNLEEASDIYRNNSDCETGNYLSIHPEGAGYNKMGLGAKVVLTAGNKKFYYYQSATRGFESASAGDVHIGLGDITIIDTLRITWPDKPGTQQELYNVKSNQKIVLKQSEATLNNSRSASLPALFSDVTPAVGIHFIHKEDSFNDFAIQPLIPHGASTEGPGLAVGDVNGDGLDDLFVCGAAGQAGALYIQTSSGNFISSNKGLMAADSLCEDVNAVFFDADNDKDLDLFVVSGGNQFEGNNPRLYDRLYINDGKGNFKKSTGMPYYTGNKSVAIPADIDHDGDLDLFIGGRVVAGRYGEAPLSYILINDGKGKFTIQTKNICPELENIGMVTDAAWTDVNRDGWMDLIVAGQWMPVSLFINKGGHLYNNTKEYGLDGLTGLWNTVKLTDINGDGHDDILLGNLGGNSKLHASKKFPLVVYIGDVDGNGYPEQILALQKDGVYYPFLGKDELQKVLPGLIRKKYPSYKSFAGQSIEQIFGADTAGLKKLSVATLLSTALVYANGKYQSVDLPEEVQWSPVFNWLTGDFNNDGFTDIIAGGNLHNVSPFEGVYDAGYGTFLSGDAKRNFKTVMMLRSGIAIKGDIRDMKLVNIANGKPVIAVAVNNSQLRFLRCNSR